MRQSALLQAKNAFEILSRLPHHGMGSKLARTSWGDDCFWTVQKVRLSPDGKHGTAWGVLTWRGQAQQPDTPVQIAGPLKRVWRAIDGAAQQQQWSGDLAAVLQAERQAAAQAAAAEQPAAAEGEQPAAA